VTRSELVHLLGGVVALLAVCGLALRLGGVRLGLAPYVAVLRGGLQLAVVALALSGALTHPLAVAAVLLVMLATATRTATGRLVGLERPGRAVVTACSLGASVALGIVFAVGVLPFQARYVVALGGILIGNTMTGATLAGRALRAGLLARREEVEAWLSLGATPRQAVADVARTAAGESLVPSLDQTRTTGLVTLPGAFIGALLGGADPGQAARFQLVVLAGILASQSVVAVVLVHLLGAPRQFPADPATAAPATGGWARGRALLTGRP
jgi:putative ABC transport system permease protein